MLQYECKREKGATKMTFLICYHGESYTMDIEDLSELQALADKYGWVKLDIDFKNFVITIH